MRFFTTGKEFHTTNMVSECFQIEVRTIKTKRLDYPCCVKSPAPEWWEVEHTVTAGEGKADVDVAKVVTVMMTGVEWYCRLTRSTKYQQLQDASTSAKAQNTLRTTRTVRCASHACKTLNIYERLHGNDRRENAIYWEF